MSLFLSTTAHEMTPAGMDVALHVRAYMDGNGLPAVEIGGSGSMWHVILDVDSAADLGSRLMTAAASIGRAELMAADGPR